MALKLYFEHITQESASTPVCPLSGDIEYLPRLSRDPCWNHPIAETSNECAYR